MKTMRLTTVLWLVAALLCGAMGAAVGQSGASAAPGALQTVVVRPVSGVAVRPIRRFRARIHHKARVARRAIAVRRMPAVRHVRALAPVRKHSAIARSLSPAAAQPASAGVQVAPAAAAQPAPAAETVVAASVPSPSAATAPVMAKPASAATPRRVTAPAASAVAAGATAQEDIEKRPLREVSADAVEPKTPKNSSLSGLIWNVVMNLLLVLALAGGSLAAWKKFKGGLQALPGQTGESVKVCSTVALAPQRFLHIVTVGDRRLLLGSSPQQVTLIADLNSSSGVRVAVSPNDGDSDELEDDRFKQLLARLETHDNERSAKPGERRGKAREIAAASMDDSQGSGGDQNPASIREAPVAKGPASNDAPRSGSGSVRPSRLFGTRASSNGAGRHD